MPRQTTLLQRAAVNVYFDEATSERLRQAAVAQRISVKALVVDMVTQAAKDLYQPAKNQSDADEAQ